MPTVSVCIPTYQRPDLLGEAIDSVLTQTYDDLELHVVDNDPEGSARRVVEKFEDDRVNYHVNERNLGMVGNWNRCLSFAKGTYVALLHDDDRWMSGFLGTMISALEQTSRAGMAFSDVVIESSTGHRHASTGTGLEGERGRPVSVSRDALFQHLVPYNRIFCPGVVLRTEAAEEFGPFDTSIQYAADWEYWLRLSLRWDAVYVPGGLAVYRDHAGSETGGLQDHRGELFRLRDAAMVLRRASERSAQANRMDRVKRCQQGVAHHLISAGWSALRTGAPWTGIQDIARGAVLSPMHALRRFGSLVKRELPARSRHRSGVSTKASEVWEE